MKTIEEVEKEYEQFKLQSEYVTSLEEFQMFIEIGIDDTEESISETLKEIKANNRAGLEVSIMNFFLKIVGTEIVGLYSEDNEILRKVITYITSYREFFEKVLAIADENNFKELVRLIDFSLEYYNQQMFYYESQRDALEYAAKGINFCNRRYSDESEVFQEFIEKKLSEYNSTKSVEKIIKMC